MTDLACCLIYLNNRHYEPTTGTFLSVDPLVALTGEPYIYGAANPVTYSDPLGLDPRPIHCRTSCGDAGTDPHNSGCGGYGCAAAPVKPGQQGPLLPGQGRTQGPLLPSGPNRACSLPHASLCSNSPAQQLPESWGWHGGTTVWQYVVLGDRQRSGKRYRTESELAFTVKGLGGYDGRWTQSVSFGDAGVYLVVSGTHGGEWTSSILAGWQGEVSVVEHGTFDALTFELDASGSGGDGAAGWTLPFAIKEDIYRYSTISLGQGTPIPGAYGSTLPFDVGRLHLGEVPGALVVSYTR